jgi:acyl-CoA synthetase (NDP forming)
MSDATSILYQALFHPRGIAIVGAAREEEKVGHLILRNLLFQGYEGRIYPVNPNADEILGIRTYPSLKDVPGPVDIAVIALKAKLVPASLRECVEKKAKFAVVVGGGFSETGEGGRQLETELLDIVRGSETRIVGPNTVGVYLPHAKVCTALTLPERTLLPPAGSIAFVSQSGALGLLTLNIISEYGTGVSAFVNLGNMIDVSEAELLEYFASDSETASVLLYLESMKNGRQLFSTARSLARKKPLVVLKAGRTPGGAKAATLHTGALATDDAVVDGALRQIGAIRAYDETELMDYGKVLAYQRPLRGGNIAVLTTAGGVGVVTADCLTSEEHGAGLSLARLEDSTRMKIRSVIVPIGSAENPIDLTAEGSTDQYREILRILNEDDNVDGIAAYALFNTARMDESLLDVLAEQTKTGKPTVVGILGSTYAKKMLMEAERRRIPAYPSMTRVVGALKALYLRGSYLMRRGLI